MVNVVVDTNIIIDVLRTQQGRLPQLLKLQEGSEIELFISVATVFELFSGQSSRNDTKTIDQILQKLELVNWDDRLARLAGKLVRDHKINLELADLIVASTTLGLDARLATNNKKHFDQIPGLKFF